MLKMQENITITGRSVIDGTEVCGFQATLKTENPDDITFNSWKINKSLYKENRAECRADENEFEDYAYTKQDEMIEALAAAATDETEASTEE